ncbi:hypothetical protein [Chryseobacterium sp. Mn2064]|uniref:hypothetical protein n=1 Tax=Chryseobacterium sp. Mn2064 TaxID=3395263 RepID=UPI003BECC070
MDTTKETIAESGTECPISGMWKVVGKYTTTMFILQKSKMPNYGGIKVSWILLYKC